MEGVFSEVGNLEVIAQKVITVEFDERVEVEQRLDAERGRYHQGEIIRERGGVSEPPEERGQRPTENFEPRAGQRHQQPLVFLRKQPGVAVVAIHGRLEIDEQQSDFVDFATKMLAGEPVGQLVPDDDAQQGPPGQRDRFRAIQPRQAELNLLPIGHRHANGEQDQCGRKPRELARKQEAQFGDCALKELIRIE